MTVHHMLDEGWGRMSGAHFFCVHGILYMAHTLRCQIRLITLARVPHIRFESYFVECFRTDNAAAFLRLIIIRRNGQLLSDLNHVRVIQLVTVCIKDTHVFVRFAVKLAADFRERIA